MEYMFCLRIIYKLYIVFLSFILLYVDWQHHAPAAERSLPVFNCTYNARIRSVTHPCRKEMILVYSFLYFFLSVYSNIS
jgi:hypothetical protein